MNIPAQPHRTSATIFTRAAIFFLSAACLVLPSATSLLSLFSILTIVFWLLSGRISLIPAMLKNNMIILLAMALMTMFIAGLLYSTAEFSYSLSILKKYRELLYFPIIISLLYDNPTARKNCEYSFIAGCIVLLLISYAMFFSIIPAARYGYSIVYHITHSFFMAFLAFWSIHKAIDSRQYRYFWVFIYGTTVINIFYIATGRTGMFVFLLLMILFVLQRLSFFQQLLGIVLITLLISITFSTSDNFRSRSTIALKEIQKYEYGHSRTSLGMRFDWWLDSLSLMKEKPLLGHGTGAFTNAHNSLIAGTKIKKTDNPHNEYLLIGVQLGLVGLTLYLLLLFTQIGMSLSLERPERYLAQGVTIAMIAGCIMNSFLFDTHQGHFFAFLSAIYFSSLPHIQSIIPDKSNG